MILWTQRRFYLMIIILFLGIAYNRLHPKSLSIIICNYILSIDLFFVDCPCYAKDLWPSK